MIKRKLMFEELLNEIHKTKTFVDINRGDPEAIVTVYVTIGAKSEMLCKENLEYSTHEMLRNWMITGKLLGCKVYEVVPSQNHVHPPWRVICCN